MAADGPTGAELNLKQVAAALDVHYMTAYRHVRSGRLPARRDGAVWLVRVEDLAAFTAAPDEVAVDEADWRHRMRRHLVAGDEVGAWGTVEAALAAGWQPEAVLVDLLSAAVAETTPADGLAAGHLATVTATRSAAALAARFRRRGRHRGTVVLGAPGGEGHSFGLAVLADVLRLRNIAVLELGGGVAPAAFVEAVRDAEGLVAVGIGVTTVEHLAAAGDVAEAVAAVAPGVAVLLGGQAVGSPEVAEVTGATGWAPDARGLAELVEGLLPTSRATGARRA